MTARLFAIAIATTHTLLTTIQNLGFSRATPFTKKLDRQHQLPELNHSLLTNMPVAAMVLHLSLQVNYQS